MVVSSRPLARSSSGRFARLPAKPLATETAPPPTSRSRTSLRSANDATLTSPEDFPEPAAKRQRVSSGVEHEGTHVIRSKRDGVFQLKPPTRVTVAQPHGGFIQTTNGVQTTLNIREDDISSQVSTPRTDGSHNEGTAGLSTGASTTQEKRTLRSHDGGSRLKSDLAIYFPNYDEIISDAPKDPGMSAQPPGLTLLIQVEFLNLNTAIYILDEPLKPSEPQPVSPTHSEIHVRPDKRCGPNPYPAGARNGIYSSPSSQPPSNTPSSHLNGAQVVDFSSISRNSTHSATDTLPDSLYFKPHRRAERKEKQLRNIEKERAMHEKVQLERLLDGLQGHDWLRVMGITGITDSEKKDWEPKRDYFVREVKALVDKFRLWKEEEKRLRLEKEQAQTTKEGEEDEAEEEGDAASDDDGPDSSDVDARAARQLQREASSAGRPQKSGPRVRITMRRPQSPDRPFTSFYTKPHLRAAALGKHRHGRTVIAFGHQLPEFREHEFALPRDYVTPDALRANARKRRRLKRESKG